MHTGAPVATVQRALEFVDGDGVFAVRVVIALHTCKPSSCNSTPRQLQSTRQQHAPSLLGLQHVCQAATQVHGKHERATCVLLQGTARQTHVPDEIGSIKQPAQNEQIALYQLSYALHCVLALVSQLSLGVDADSQSHSGTIRKTDHLTQKQHGLHRQGDRQADRLRRHTGSQPAALV